MAKKKIAYIQFPGSNTENETKNILQKHGMLPFGHFWNDPSELLNDFDGFIILGGFSFEDRSRSGIIASLEPVVNELKKQGIENCRIEGKDSNDWKLVDAHDVIVHIFHPEKREFYDLEKMWSEEIPKERATL